MIDHLLCFLTTLSRAKRVAILYRAIQPDCQDVRAKRSANITNTSLFIDKADSSLFKL